MAKRGRPSEFTQEIADEICARIAKGESVRAICADNDGFLPSDRTVYRWLEDNEAFCQQYVRAREIQADSKFEQAWEIASTATAENVQVARLQVDTVKWQASKLAPKKYGERTTTDLNAAVNLNITKIVSEIVKAPS